LCIDPVVLPVRADEPDIYRRSIRRCADDTDVGLAQLGQRMSRGFCVLGSMQQDIDADCIERKDD
jgi:hypothetical protein